MSTDLVYASDSIAPALTAAVLSRLSQEKGTHRHRLISPASKSRLNALIADAEAQGATIHRPFAPSDDPDDTTYPPTIIANLTPSMQFYNTESFGPIIGIVPTSSESHSMDLVSQSTYGLSAAIFTTSHFRALKLAERIQAGAVHVNSMTVHDEPTLPHGGKGESGFGRFGARWGVEEFLETRMVVLNP